MRRQQNWSFWAAVTCLGLGLGSALHCQTPATHVRVEAGEDCSTCHASDFQSASQPPHLGIISTGCADCHGNTRWAPARGSNHSWLLDGAHAVTACNACHLGSPPVYESTPGACVDCHRVKRDQVLEPSHADFSDDCQSCHGTAAWRPAAIEHAWPLEGAHASTPCASCHTGDPPVYEGTPDQCIGCHQADRDAVTQPPHDGFAQTCGSCHTSSAWQPADFPAHEWPLEGAHATATCASCHLGDPPAYDDTPTACLSCHEQDRGNVTQPPHDAFSDDCASCHDAASWGTASFDHLRFPLTGAHQAAECSSCHTGTPAVFLGTATECVGCHREDYDTSPFPGHSDFATTCQDCHLTSGWRPASGGNHPQDRFSITGDHDFACNDCHNPSLGPNGVGNADCVGCHEGEHTLARMDNEHDGIRNYPTGQGRSQSFCLSCHADGRE